MQSPHPPSAAVRFQSLRPPRLTGCFTLELTTPLLEFDGAASSESELELTFAFFLAGVP